jgi:hypothetical protein
MLAWLASDRGLLVLGTSVLLGALGYLCVDCLRLWSIRGKARDMVDLLSTATFTAMIAGIALSLNTYDSLPVGLLGVAAGAVSYETARRFLRVRQT